MNRFILNNENCKQSMKGRIYIVNINKNTYFLITLLSALLFCFLIIVISLSPLASYGKNANQFNSVGMWSSIGIIIMFYVVPLIAYLLGLKLMKYVTAILVFLALLTDLALTMLNLILPKLNKSITIASLSGVLGICIISLIVNFSWFFIAFAKSSKAISKTQI